MINKFSFTIFTFSLLSVYMSKFQTWQFFLVKEKLTFQIFLDKENLPTILHLHKQFFLVKVNLSRKNCSCKCHWFNTETTYNFKWDFFSDLLNVMWKKGIDSFIKWNKMDNALSTTLQAWTCLHVFKWREVTNASLAIIIRQCWVSMSGLLPRLSY